MKQFTEVSITIKSSEARYTQKFPVYEPYTLDVSDPIIKNLLDQAKANYGKDLDIEDITIKAILSL